MALAGLLDRYTPAWLANQSPLPSWGYRFRRVCEKMVDCAVETLLEGMFAGVGRGTPTAMPYIGQEWDVTRGRSDTDAQYSVKLRSWIDRAKNWGSAYQMATDIWEYLGGPRVRVVNRNGFWIDVAAGGTTPTITTYTATWNWDSLSNPERHAGGVNPELGGVTTPYTSDIWIIIQPTYSVRPGTLGAMTGADGFALGHLAPNVEVDAMMHLMARDMAAHSCIRAVIWTSDSTRFNPAVPTTMPDGWWGQWSINDGAGNQIPSHRDLTTCRYWEPRG